MPALKKLEGALRCVWAAGEVGAGDMCSCLGSQGQREQNHGPFARFLFNSVSSVDGGSGSARSYFANGIVALHLKGCPEPFNLH